MALMAARMAIERQITGSGVESSADASRRERTGCPLTATGINRRGHAVATIDHTLRHGGWPAMAPKLAIRSRLIRSRQDFPPMVWAGHDTLGRLDAELSQRMDPPPLPGIPGRASASSVVNYNVPGPDHPGEAGRRQWPLLGGHVCRDVSVAHAAGKWQTRAIIVTLGEPYISYYDTEQRLGARIHSRLCQPREYEVGIPVRPFR